MYLAGSGVPYVFLIITPLSDTGRSEPLTELPILKPSIGPSLADADADHIDNTSQDIIGIRSLSNSVAQWMVPYDAADLQMAVVNKEVTADTELLHVNWRIHFG